MFVGVAVVQGRFYDCTLCEQVYCPPWISKDELLSFFGSVGRSVGGGGGAVSEAAASMQAASSGMWVDVKRAFC